MVDEPRQSPDFKQSNKRTGVAKVQARPIIRPERLSDQVIESLRTDLESGRVAPGSRLPSEMELAASFNVSRTVIREAIWRLHSDGLVVSRQGSGIYATHPSEAVRSFRLGLQDAKSKTSTRELYELRIGVECEAASLAAQRCTRADLVSLEKLVTTLSCSGDDLELGVQADVHFHRKIAKLSKNILLLRFEEFLAAVLTEAVMLARENSSRYEGLSDLVLQEHVEIFEAISSADPLRSRAAMRAHLVKAQERLGLL